MPHGEERGHRSRVYPRSASKMRKSAKADLRAARLELWAKSTSGATSAATQVEPARLALFEVPISGKPEIGVLRDVRPRCATANPQDEGGFERKARHGCGDRPAFLPAALFGGFLFLCDRLGGLGFLCRRRRRGGRLGAARGG